MSNNLYNILAAFQNATKPAEVETPKQQAQKIYESVEAKGSIMGGVKGVEKKLSEAYAEHKVSEAKQGKIDFEHYRKQDAAKDKAVKKADKDAKAKEKAKTEKKVEEGKMSDLDYELKAKEVSDADFKKKYGKSKADMKKSFNAPKKDEKPVKEGKWTHNAKTGAKLNPRTGDTIPGTSTAEKLAARPPKAPRVVTPAHPPLSLDAVWRKVEDVVGQIYPDGDPIDWLVPWLNKHGYREHQVGAILDKAAKKNGYNDIYAYWQELDDQMKSDAAYDAQMGEGMNEADVYEPWYDEKDAASSTQDTETGRVHRAGRGGYGNKVDDDQPIAMPPGQVARGRGRPKNMAGELRRQAQADRLAANGGVKAGRGRPKKNPGLGAAPAGTPDSAPQGTLGLHRFLFGPMPTKLPGKPGLKHKIKDESIAESVAPKGNLKGYLTESFQNPGSDAFEHILHRFKNEVKRFQAGEDMDNDLYDALFDYYLNSGEMPYGVAKARSGDPYEWVAQRFADDMPMDEAVDPLTVPAVHRKAAGQAPLSLDQVRAPRADSISDKRNLAQANGSKDLDDLARLAGITTESVSVIGGDVESEMSSEPESKMNISTNQSSDGTKNVTVTADGEAAVALLDMLKNAGMGGSEAAQRQEVIIATPGEEEMSGSEMDMGDSGAEVEMEEEYANEPAPQYQSVEKQMSAGDDMNRQKKQNFPLRAPGNNPMSEMSIDPGKSMGRDLMAEYQAMKLQK